MEEKNPKTLTSEIASQRKYEKSPLPAATPPTNELDKVKGKLEDFKKSLVKKYPFVMAIVLLPGTSYAMFEEDEAVPKEVVDTKPMHAMVLIPEEHYKNLAKIKPEVLKLAKETGENLWIHIKTPVDLWNYGLDSKFEFIDAISAGFPIYDKGFLGALRVAAIHKSLVLRKFEKYVATYAIGGSLVRGTAGKDSDVDTIVIIDDTDVKRMSRIELLEKLRGIIYDYIREANALAGVKNPLNVQVWLLTDFWQRVKDAEPVAFTFIRDGIPLWDRGTFIPWKLLLKMGKIKPSPEAVDVFMKSGEQTEALVKRRMLDAMVDIYYGIVTPTQAVIMLAGEGPEAPKHLSVQARRIFMEKEKLMSEKELKILEKAVYLFKQYEYGKLQTMSGKDLDEFKKEGEVYLKKMKEVRIKIEKRLQEQTVDKVYADVFSLLKNLLGNKSTDALIKEVNNQLIKKGKLHPRMMLILKEIVAVKKKSKPAAAEVENMHRDSAELINSLIEYSQRKELAAIEKSIIPISYGNKKAEIVITDHGVFVTDAEGMVKKVSGEALKDSNKTEMDEALQGTKNKLRVSLTSHAFEAIRKSLGDFEMSL